MSLQLAAVFAGALLAQSATASAAPPAPSYAPAKISKDAERTIFISGNRLKELCDQDQSICMLYIVGVSDGQTIYAPAASRDVAYCIPRPSNSGQVRDVVLNYLNAHPEERHLPAAILVTRSLATAWPQCQ